MKKKFFYMKDKIKSKKERKSRKEEKINLNEIAPYEEVNLDTSESSTKNENTPEVKKKLSLNEMLKEKWNNLSINRERKRKIDEQNRKLILEIQKEIFCFLYL